MVARLLWEQEAASSSLATPIEGKPRYSVRNSVYVVALFVAYRLEMGWKVRQKCDKFRKNLFCATVCALFCVPSPISYGCIRGCFMPCCGLGTPHFTAYLLFPRLWGTVSNTDPIHKGMNQIHTPDTKKCQHRHKRRWTAPICATGSKLRWCWMPSKLSVVPFDHFWTNGAYFNYDPLPGLPDSTITEL